LPARILGRLPALPDRSTSRVVTAHAARAVAASRSAAGATRPGITAVRALGGKKIVDDRH